MSSRECSKQACSLPAVATLTFVYADSTAVIGPLAIEAEPHTYDLCAKHAAAFTAPRGWKVITLPAPATPATDDVLALANALMDSAPRKESEKVTVQPEPQGEGRHLRVLRSSDER